MRVASIQFMIRKKFDVSRYDILYRYYYYYLFFFWGQMYLYNIILGHLYSIRTVCHNNTVLYVSCSLSYISYTYITYIHFFDIIPTQNITVWYIYIQWLGHAVGQVYMRAYVYVYLTGISNTFLSTYVVAGCILYREERPDVRLVAADYGLNRVSYMCLKIIPKTWDKN